MKKKNKKLIYIRIIFLIVLVVSNTFAWFIYVTRVDNRVSVHVKSWDVTLQSGDEEISSTVNINIDSLYPGMEDYLYQINAYNKSEVEANLSYSVLEANILGAEYITKEGRAARLEEEQSTDLTSDELEDMFANDFPFQLLINLSDTTIGKDNGNAAFSISAQWPYDGKSDLEDTRWGISAANYKKVHSDSPSISLKIDIILTQSND